MTDWKTHWKTHRRLLLSALVPLAVIAGLFAFLAATEKSYGAGFHYAGFFLTDPLSTGLDLLTGLAVATYLVSLSAGPRHPRHRGFFAAGTFVAGLVMNGIYIRMLRETRHFYKVNGTLTFFTAVVLFYCVYRLVVLLPLHTRKWAVPALGLLVFAAGLFQAWNLHALSGLPCLPPHQWLELTGRC
ncbi:MAG: hypothetical protein KGL10_02070 [Alphaproteobacteria bacterium]|nr:hypothetical protein [Alphaproteobacteria bacterium]MDE2336075.1 hypothetical protein [Alphaproteobacteria bacterium]